jgi:hypothetical protein
MAPPSPGSQPPFEQSDVAQREEQAEQGQRGEAAGAYGPLGIQRYVKDDGRALILYARRVSEDA